MSLRTAAQYLAAQGRNGDTHLVHMTPREVRSLQDLAKAYGTSLTINPKTGLTEAFNLNSFLPAAAGIALNAAFPGLGALGSAALVGGAVGAESGSLQKGLVAGLGAYGGIGLTEGITSGMLTPSMFGDQAGAAAGLSGASEAAGVPGAMGSESALTAGEAAQAGQAAEAAKAAEAARAQAAQQGAAQKEAANYTSGADYSTAGTKYAGSGEGLQGAPAQQAPASPYSLTPPTTDYSLTPAPVTSPTQLPNAVPGEQPTLMETLKRNATRKNLMMAGAPLVLGGFGEQRQPQQPPTQQPFNPQRYRYERGEASTFPTADPQGRAREYFPTARYVPIASGGAVMGYADGGVPGKVEQMSIANSIGQNTGYPQAAIAKGAYATPWQTPVPRNMLEGAADTGVNPMTGQMSFAEGGDLKLHRDLMNPRVSAAMDKEPMKKPKGLSEIAGLSDMRGISDEPGLYASGGLSDLGSYSDGGRLLRGPGDGVSDSIPAVIGRKQPARLADGEFVVPARIVSEIGNGSTEAGARKLYAMMDRVQKARGKTVGKGKVAKNTRAEKYLPA